MIKIVAGWILISVGIGLIPLIILGFSPGGVDLVPPIFVTCLFVGLLGAAIHSVINTYRRDSVSSKKSTFALLFFAVSIILFQLFSYSDNKPVSKELEPLARDVVTEYLTKKNLPIENLREYVFQLSPKPHFSYLYKGAGRCMALIANCYGNSCRHIGTYPFYEHGEKCPDTQ